MLKKIANWGNYPVIESDEKTFSRTREAQAYVKDTQLLIARGNGRCYGDASLASHTLSTLQYNKFISFDKETGIIECQAGLTLDKILEITVPLGWFLPVTPGTKFITVGGAVASDVHGKNHHVDGCFSRHIITMEIVLATGETVTCSSQQLPDLFWASCGGMGLTGVITLVTFQLKKIATSFIRQKQIKARNLDEVLNLFETHKNFTYSVAWIDCLQKGKNFGRSILMLGEHATLAEIPMSKQSKALALPKKKQLSFPFYLPSFALNKLTVKAFNFLYYAKNIKKEINNIVPYEPFFYPLDAILHWNRGYGKKGFVQYQFVLPMKSKEGLIEILKKISSRGMGSFLAVLKIFGPQDDLISFPMEGYTLALDFPVTKNLFPFLDELDEIVKQYEGRIYLSKDARMKPATYRTGYKNADEFATILNKYNPQQSIQSLQSARLDLFK